LDSFEIVAVIIGIFFVVGIVVGVILVAALPALRNIQPRWTRSTARRHEDALAYPFAKDGASLWGATPGSADGPPSSAPPSNDNGRPSGDASTLNPVGGTLPISIFLSEEETHEQVESAVQELLASAGLRITGSDDPVIGSWFRKMRAVVGDAAHSDAARQGALIATHIADSHLVLAQDAAITATLMQNLGPVISSLQPTRDAVVRLGAVLIVKVDWTVGVYQLTAAQQAVLDHNSYLATKPYEIIAKLRLTSDEDGSDVSPPTISMKQEKAEPSGD
jgi:hypothetical protein